MNGEPTGEPVGEPAGDRPAAPVAAAGSALDARARTLLGELAARPRPAGSEVERDARARCARWLGELGFVTAERPFEYSALPGRWGTPLAGAASMLVLVAAAASGAAGRAGAGLALMGAAAAVMTLSGLWMARRGVLDAPVLRRRSTNLIATRGESPPAVWLVAHLDSKSQPVPIGLRAAGVMGSLVAWPLTGSLLLASAAGAVVPGAAWAVAGAAGVLCALPVLASTVGERSDGALDNASGVAAVLAAAALLPRDDELPVGVALTSAEELGLAGARAWAAGMAPATALNCDGVDDLGEILVMYSGRAPRGVLEALAGAEGGARMRMRRLLPGILTDHVALADAGWATATVSRGGAATLRRIHTRADSLARLRGDGLLEVARILAGAAIELARRPAPVPPPRSDGAERARGAGR